MADVTSFDSVSGVDLTESQIKGILTRINLNIYNLLDGKWDAVDHAEFGSSGHRSDPTKLLAQLRALKKEYETMLEDLPVEIYSQWDNPEL